MVEALQSPPATRETSPQSTRDDGDIPSLTRRLDELLEQYLELLDQYTTLREEFSKSLADGYFSLARAQHTSSLGPGRRYGQDGFDGRMKALKRVNIATRHATQYTGDGSESKTVQYEPEDTQTQQSEPTFMVIPYGEASDFKREELHKLGSQASTEKTEKLSEQEASNDTKMKTQKVKSDPGYRDPATWFSILVPQTLRQAQQSFSTSVDTILPKLLNITSSLDAVEFQIRTIRNKIALGADHSSVKGTSQLLTPS